MLHLLCSIGTIITLRDKSASALQETAAWHLSGAMDVHLLQQALAAVAQRHDLLRARFWRKDGQLMQSIDGSVPRLEQKPFSSSNESIEGLIQVFLVLSWGDNACKALIAKKRKGHPAVMPIKAS
jgi:hypothetical protein